MPADGLAARQGLAAAAQRDPLGVVDRRQHHLVALVVAVVCQLTRPAAAEGSVTQLAISYTQWYDLHDRSYICSISLFNICCIL